MQDLVGKTAFVTGGASGIGLALGRAFAEAGMNVMLADIEAEALTGAVRTLHGTGPGVRGVICDVADPASVDDAAKAAYEAFGTVHIVCNSAGVGGGSGIDAISLDTWRWVLDVNLMGVLHGIRTFLPHIRAHGEGGHIVNTASMAGMNSGIGFSPYAASKFAVVNNVGRVGEDGRPAGHWRDRAVSLVCANANLGERAQPTGALRPAPDAGPGKPVGQVARQACRIRAVGARSIRRRDASSRCSSQKRTLRVHASQCGMAG
jgi:NAD(P)-dependent dehydrogenase (short-subunit alcohol dehydrogenase family)